MKTVVNSPTPLRRHPVSRFPYERLSDAELVRAVAQGDNHAVAAVWDRYAGLVRGVLRSSLGLYADVEDLLQEVFIGFVRGAPNMRSGDALRSYLVGVAVRRVMVELRRRHVRRWVMLSAHGELPEPRAVAHQSEEARQVLQALERVLDRLPPRRRLAFVLRHVEGLEVTEAARALAVSEATIKREVSRARATIARRAQASEPLLWEYMQRAGVDEHD